MDTKVIFVSDDLYNIDKMYKLFKEKEIKPLNKKKSKKKQEFVKDIKLNNYDSLYTLSLVMVDTGIYDLITLLEKNYSYCKFDDVYWYNEELDTIMKFMDKSSYRFIEHKDNEYKCYYDLFALYDDSIQKEVISLFPNNPELNIVFV